MAAIRKPALNSQPPPADEIAEYILWVPLEQAILDPKNSREHQPRSVATIRGSLRRFGQRKPVVIHQPTMTIIAGNGTRMALEAETEAHRADTCQDKAGKSPCYFCKHPDEIGKIKAVFTNLSADEAMAYGITDNRASDVSRFDFTMLGSHLKHLTKKGFEFQNLGWYDFELKPLLATGFRPVEISHLSPAKSGEHRLSFNEQQYELIKQVASKAREQLKTPELTEEQAIEVACKLYLGA